MQSVLTGTEQGNQEKQLNAALSAEERVGAIIEEESCGGIPVFLRRRVFVAECNHNREIDVVAIADNILAIEVKNWSGSVWRNGNRWFQLAVRAQRPLEFEDIFKEARVKAVALQRHLENDHKIAMSSHSAEAAAAGAPKVIPVLVFTNPTVKLDPNTIANMDFVFTLDTFREYLRRNVSLIQRQHQTWTQWVSQLVIPNFLRPKRTTAALTQSEKDEVEAALGTVRTWDTVVLHNGAMMHGDVVAVECPSASCGYQRYHLHQITLTWSTPTLLGLMGSLWNGTAGTVKLTLCDAKRIPKKNEAKPRDKDGNIFFPVMMPKRNADIRTVDRILMKKAGSARVEPIPLSTIRSIDLSQHLTPSMVLKQQTTV